MVSPDGSHVLLNLHRKARRWFHFGGHCEPGDSTLRGAATREGREESGLADLALSPEPVDLSAHDVPFCGGHASVEHLDVRYAAVASAESRLAVSDESLDVRWWPVDDLPDSLEPEMHVLIDAARAYAATQAGS